MKTIENFLNRSLGALLLLLWGHMSLSAQTVVQSRGVDPQVQYESLKQFGPWDDRNYQLTAADLQVLAPNEAELRDPIPAFYRVIYRKSNPDMRRTGPGQYPMSVTQTFLQEYGGYLIDGKLYQQVEREGRQFRVLQQEKPALRSFEKSLFLVGETRVTSPSGAAECTVEIHPTDPSRVIAGSNGPGGGQRMHWSSNGGETWTMVDLPLGSTCCDPTVEWSSDGHFAYAGALGGNHGIWFYRSSDDGHNWDDLETITPGDPRRELTGGGSDKEFLHVDKSIGSPFRDNIYMTWHNGNVMQFGRSTDRGNTWATMGFGADPIGIGSDITTDRAGNIYYFWHAFGTQQVLLKRSTDGGATFLPGAITVAATNAGFGIPIPSQESREAHTVVAADADVSTGPFSNSIYAAWMDTYGPVSGNPADNHARVQVAFSRNGGATWTVVTPHPVADQNTVDRWQPWLSVGRDGTVHVIYYDTRHSVGRTGVDLYYSFSTDGAQTFSTPQRLTAATSPNLSDVNEFLDYNGLDHVVCQLALFTDSRSESGGGGSSKDIYSIGIDNDPPNIVCPANITVNNAPGLCSATVSFAASGSDACSEVSLSYSPASGASFNVGTTTVTATASDGANTRTCQFAVTVVDNQPPAIACPPNRTQSCELPTTPATTGNPVTLDNCAVASVTHSDVTTPGSCPGNYSIARTWLVTDVHSLTNSCVQTITIQDITPPVTTCPPNITVMCNITPDSTGRATVTDNCDMAPGRAFSDGTPTGDCAWLCSFDRTWVGTDNCGNTSSCVQRITKSTLPLIEKALKKDLDGDGRTDILVLGISNSTLSIPPGRGNCVLQWMPGTGTTPTGLKFEKAVTGTNCKPGTNPQDGAGQLLNPLLAEALKLHIMVRLKAGLGAKKLSDYGSCISPIVLHYLAPNPDVNELLRVTNTALGNVAVQPHLAELLAALLCINATLDVCN